MNEKKPNDVRVREIARQVRSLSRHELAAFREWFEEYDEKTWDRQIEEDAAEGKLDELAERAKRSPLGDGAG